MNWSLLAQQFAAYCVATIITGLATRYHLTQEQQGLISTDLYAGLGVASTMAYGLWTHHRAYLATPNGGSNVPNKS